MRKCLIITFIFFGCVEKEEVYPPEPVIELVSIEFFDPPDPGRTDSLIVTFSFTDGDADFGLDDQHISPPFNRYFFVHKGTGELISSDKLENNEISVDQLIQYADKEYPPYDTLPELSDGCFYSYLYAANLYSIYNENSANVFIDFFYEDGLGNFVKWDLLEKTYCLTLDGRVFSGSGTSGPFVRKMTNPKKGQISYCIQSVGFIHFFQDKKIKLKLSIQDRALNRSNILETAEFSLSEI